MPSLQTLVLSIVAALISGILIGSVGMYKWTQAGELADLQLQIAADNKALKFANDRAGKAEIDLAQLQATHDQLMSEREKDRAQHPAICKPSSTTVDFLRRITAPPAELPR